jgi:hypothetical protein
MTESKRPRVNNEGQKELDKVESQIDKFSDSVSLASERNQNLPFKETEPQTKLSQAEINASSNIYLKPKRIFPSREKFNEKFRDEFNRQSQYVEFIAENHEVKGESIDLCIKKFPGMPVEEWIVPVNKNVSAPLYVKERIQQCGYTVFTTVDRSTGSEGGIVYYGQMVSEEVKSRLSVKEVVRKSRIYLPNKIFA